MSWDITKNTGSTGVHQISLQYLTERPSMTWANKVSWNMTGIQVHAAVGLRDIINFLLIKNTSKWGLWPYTSLICILVVLARLKTESNYILNILSTIKFYFASMWFEGMILLCFLTIATILSAQKESQICVCVCLCVGGGVCVWLLFCFSFFADVQKGYDGPLCWFINVKLIQIYR
jgi:hypothetical protein